MILKVIFSLYFVLEVMERVNTGCSTQPYVNTKGLTCYPCSPGFRVLMECNSNGSTNMCAPCASDEFQPNCEKRAISCRKCSSCNRPHLTVSKNCTHEHDTVCNCTEGWYWDTYEAICRSSEPGKHIVKDAESTELPTGAITTTTEKGTTVTTAEAKTTKTANTKCECSECEGQYNIIVVLLSAILLIELILTYPRLKIFLAYVRREIAKRGKAKAGEVTSPRAQHGEGTSAGAQDGGSTSAGQSDQTSGQQPETERRSEGAPPIPSQGNNGEGGKAKAGEVSSPRAQHGEGTSAGAQDGGSTSAGQSDQTSGQQPETEESEEAPLIPSQGNNGEGGKAKAGEVSSPRAQHGEGTSAGAQDGGSTSAGQSDQTSGQQPETEESEEAPLIPSQGNNGEGKDGVHTGSNEKGTSGTTKTTEDTLLDIDPPALPVPECSTSTVYFE